MSGVRETGVRRRAAAGGRSADAVGRDRSPPHPTARADLACLQDAALDELPGDVVDDPESALEEVAIRATVADE